MLRVFAGLLICHSVIAGNNMPAGELRPGYVDETSCVGCHPKQGQAWQRSKHRLAMQPATSHSVKGDFTQALPGKFAEDVRLTAASGQFHLTTPGPDGLAREYPVPYVLGVHPLQQLLVALSGGRLQAFTLAWDTIRHRWFDLQAEETIPPQPGESLHWSGRYQNWNLMCGECHTTAYRKQYSETTDHYQTTWAMDHVGCQACHGPGQAHVRQRRNGKALAYDPPRGSFSQVDQCAGCHARRTRLREEANPKGTFLDNFQPDTLRADLYYPDGQQLAEVFEYGSYRQSRMYQAGVACSDCHDTHSGQLHATGNALCVRCHNASPDPRYSGLKAKVYDSPQHHFHPEGAAGSQCVDCHMPSRNYMVVHPRRDHAIRIPRPDLSLRLGTPNACNQCHADKDVLWAQTAIEQHHGTRNRPPHYGEIIAAGRRGENLSALRELTGDLQQPAIVRATALEILASQGPQLLPVTALQDSDAAVRSVAAIAFAAYPVQQRRDLLLPLLHDSTLAVRIAAARGLASLSPADVPAKYRTALHLGLRDYIAAQQAMADMPAAQLSLALLQTEIGMPEAAALHFRRALTQDPGFNPARLNFARWLYDQGRNPEAESILQDGVSLGGNISELQQALALLLARQGKYREADRVLTEALVKTPEDVRLRQLKQSIQKFLAGAGRP